MLWCLTYTSSVSSSSGSVAVVTLDATVDLVISFEVVSTTGTNLKNLKVNIQRFAVEEISRQREKDQLCVLVIMARQRITMQ